MAQEFYGYAHHLDGITAHLIWFTDQIDGVLLDENRRLLRFPDPSALQQYACGHQIVLQMASTEIDLDAIECWTAAPARERIDCMVFLDAWNLCDDIARSLGQSEFLALSEKSSDVYDMLFWGCNLPAVTPAGQQFVPTWSDDAVCQLRRVLVSGIEMIRRN